MKSEAEQVKQHFTRVPRQWDALYSRENRLRYAINRCLRPGLSRRYEMTFKRCGDLTGAKVLDIGCGTGRYSVECARRGAERVVGIDFASSMIDSSRAAAQEMHVADVCEFICDDFLTHPFEEEFDVVLALGFFDYIRRAGPVIAKVASLSPSRFMASFPRFTLIWGLQRHVRYYWIKRCPVFNYRKAGLENLYQQACFESVELVEGSRGFFVAAGMKGKSRRQGNGQRP